MKADSLFHVGIVSDDPAATRADLSALFGYEWGPEIGGPVVVTMPSGVREVDMQCAYSIVSRVAQSGLERCWATPAAGGRA